MLGAVPMLQEIPQEVEALRLERNRRAIVKKAPFSVENEAVKTIRHDGDRAYANKLRRTSENLRRSSSTSNESVPLSPVAAKACALAPSTAHWPLHI